MTSSSFLGSGIFIPTNPTGPVTGTNPFDNIGPSDRTFGKVSFIVKVGSCEQTVKVPRSLYYSLNRYIYGLLNSDSSTRRSFTPADEAMIIFYTTIAKQAQGCR